MPYLLFNEETSHLGFFFFLAQKYLIFPRENDLNLYNMLCHMTGLSLKLVQLVAIPGPSSLPNHILSSD